MTEATGPTQTPRPALPTKFDLTSATIYAQIGVIVTWVVSLAASALPVPVPESVQGAVNMLLVGGIVGIVSYVASRMRFAQWAATGEVTGAKKLLTLALILAGATTMLGCAMAHGPAGTAIAFGQSRAAVSAKGCSAHGGELSDNATVALEKIAGAAAKGAAQGALGGGIPDLGGLFATPDAVADPVVVPEP